tara:strand:- start:523 stop:933 length:411 start_codon:yes stop_codon:yes gene_type:complete
MDFYVVFLYSIIVLKVCFAISLCIAITRYANIGIISDSLYDKNHEIKEKLENLYIFLMSITLIIIFRDRSRIHFKFSNLELELLFLFGIVLFMQTFTNWLKKYTEKRKKKNDDISNTLEVTADFFIPDTQVSYYTY